MRVICFLFLLAFIAAVGIFVYYNRQTVDLRYLEWSTSQPIAVVVLIAYGLGMVSGWTVVGMLRRSLDRVVEATAAGYERRA
jgi:uncharacterized integral membrane protein